MNQTHEWKAIRVSWRGLNQELIPPAIECVETLGVVDVVDQYAAVGTSVERNA